MTPNDNGGGSGTPSSVEALTPGGVERTYSSNANTLFLSNGGNSVIKKRVWTPVSEARYNQDTSQACHNSFGELQKAYFRLLEEKNGLKEQLSVQEKKNKRLEEEVKVKDKRILSLENKLNVMMIDSGHVADTTDC